MHTFLLDVKYRISEWYSQLTYLQLFQNGKF